jgi:hypothetical protein
VKTDSFALVLIVVLVIGFMLFRGRAAPHPSPCKDGRCEPVIVPVAPRPFWPHW